MRRPYRRARALLLPAIVAVVGCVAKTAKPSAPQPAAVTPPVVGATSDVAGTIAAGAATGAAAAPASGTVAAPPPLFPATAAKKGLAMFTSAGSKGSQVGASWYYNWSSTPYLGGSGGLEFVPMVWGLKNATSSTLAQIKASGAQNMLGFNEPDHTDQANMSPAAAAQAWPQLMQVGIRLGSPATADATNGWLANFMALVKQNNYRVDFLTVHYYPNASANPVTLGQHSIADLQMQLQNLYATYNLPIWVTEFGVCTFTTTGSLNDSQVQTYVGQVVAMLQNLGFVERYSWFADGSSSMCGQSAVFDGGGNLTATGQAYQGAGH